MKDIILTVPDEVATNIQTWFASLSQDEEIEVVLTTKSNRKTFGRIAQLLRLALSGGSISPPICETMAIMGKDKVLRRIERAIGPPGDNK